MYPDPSPATARRSTAERPQLDTATTRRTRVDDAIVSQWLLEQVPADHRHALLNASDPRRDREAVGVA
jgi:hypothetical protein